MARSDGELEALYRFLNNPRVTLEGVLAPHIEATMARAKQAESVVVAHDTTEFDFENGAEDLGYLSTGHRGFFGHFALVLDGDATSLGIGGLITWKRKRGRKWTNAERSGEVCAKDETRESLRWGALVETVESRLPSGRSAVHVMDREADVYRLFADLVAKDRRFVIRIKKNRGRHAAELLSDEWELLSDVAERASFVAEREVLLSKRTVKPPLKRYHPNRHQRWATLHIEAMPIVLRRPRYLAAPLPEDLSLSFVRVREVDAPLGEQPVEWWLVTTESIATQVDVERIVDWYRARWKIEEFFKALKTGCQFEKRGLESYDALLRTLGLLVPIAWQLLGLRDKARQTPDAPATVVFSPQQLRILRGLSKRLTSDTPTLNDALLAVAGEGGHLMRNGAPGWQTLGIGLEKLWWAEFGYQMALADTRSRAKM